MKKRLLRTTLSVLFCLFIGFLVTITSQKSLHPWYTTLNKPSFTPPYWVFFAVWNLLYFMMGISLGIIWNKGFYHKLVKTALYHFGFQLLLNVSWFIFFFGLQNSFIALLDITTLFILLLFTIKWFKFVNATAAYLLVPYILWVAFATALNFCIWQLN
ncbi:TspO/MBR family protein [Aquimarina hainanensis]|uniref:TspO/MBR family protein n=1 Tax=Aquimarina hainanensis TaxID=1578017 RepID=A0ABW5N4V7_9FLAO|nr:TspO/MBR family protein [Aquimarina sp. TRL1]QKX04304.1 tryptophan-rich sensory protein [Aquimarina sp. TRL1]